MFRRPASICVIEVNEAFVPGLPGESVAEFVLTGCASTAPMMTSSAAAKVMAALRKNRRRSFFISSGISLS
jgi:hypothetical protein